MKNKYISKLIAVTLIALSATCLGTNMNSKPTYAATYNQLKKAGFHFKSENKDYPRLIWNIGQRNLYIYNYKGKKISDRLSYLDFAENVDYDFLTAAVIDGYKSYGGHRYYLVSSPQMISYPHRKVIIRSSWDKSHRLSKVGLIKDTDLKKLTNPRKIGIYKFNSRTPFYDITDYRHGDGTGMAFDYWGTDDNGADLSKFVEPDDAPIQGPDKYTQKLGPDNPGIDPDDPDEEMDPKWYYYKANRKIFLTGLKVNWSNKMYYNFINEENAAMNEFIQADNFGNLTKLSGSAKKNRFFLSNTDQTHACCYGAWISNSWLKSGKFYDVGYKKMSNKIPTYGNYKHRVW